MKYVTIISKEENHVKKRKIKASDNVMNECPAILKEPKILTDEEAEQIANEIREQMKTTKMPAYESPALKAIEKNKKVVFWRTTGLFY